MADHKSRNYLKLAIGVLIVVMLLTAIYAWTSYEESDRAPETADDVGNG